MSQNTPHIREAVTSIPILDVLAQRWSPRSFDPAATIDDDTITAVLEAARWAPSAFNHQPWRFIVGRKGGATFDAILERLVPFNQGWARNSSALVVAIAVTEAEDGSAHPWAHYDLGQASAHLSVQAHHLGLHVHQMGGFDAEALSAAFELPASQTPVTVLALGRVASPDALEIEALRERETAPRERLALETVVVAND